MTNTNWRILGHNIEIGGYDLWRIGALFGALLMAFAFGKLARQALLAGSIRWEKSQRLVAGAAGRALAKSIELICMSIGLKTGIGLLDLSPKMSSGASTATSVLFVCAVFWALFCSIDVVDFWIKRVSARTSSKLDDMLAPILKTSMRITVVILAILQVATILSDKPVTSLLAGLGVGGLAVALAAQDTMKNFFGSISIFADKPFEIGDRIAVDGHDGSVEMVGFRSTRIRTLEGNLVSIPNGEIANKTILNIGRRPHIRSTSRTSITYGTPPDKVARAVSIIEGLLKDHEGMEPDFPPRVYFEKFDASALVIIVFYWYHPPKYWDFMKFNESLNMTILREFNRENISFALPTQTIHIAAENEPSGSQPQ